MTQAEGDALANGLYRLHWVSGGSSVAAVGHQGGTGDAWYAPTDWDATNGHAIPNFDWSLIDHVEAINE
jgi:hypothetical protein